MIGDVGQNAWEEVDFLPQASGGGRGANLGWDACEANHLYEGVIPGVTNPTPSQQSAFCNSGGRTGPVFEYAHSGGRCSITGGFISHDPGTPAYDGRYFYADVCEGRIRTVLPGTGAPGGATGDRDESLPVGSPSSFGEDACGRLYVASLSSGEVSRIQGATPTVCGEDTPPTEPPPPPTEPQPPSEPPSPPVPPSPPPPPSRDDGPCAPSTKLGDSGSDELVGTARADALSGAGAADTLRGAAGPDCLDGARGKDDLAGRRGGDELYPGPGRDRVRAGRGADEVRAEDGTRDRVACGAGRADLAYADAVDRVEASCERVKIAR